MEILKIEDVKLEEPTYEQRVLVTLQDIKYNTWQTHQNVEGLTKMLFFIIVILSFILARHC